jgi:2-keto-4-pentenoate hydratase
LLDNKANIIINHRENKTLIPDLKHNMPLDIDEAYVVQESLVNSLNLNPIGWKVGCTTKMAQNFSGMTEPFSGVMFKETTYISPNLEISDYMYKPIIEPELCFEIKEDIVDNGELYNKINIEKYIESIFPVIEIVDARYQKAWDIKAIETISDNGVHCCLVKGKKLFNWHNYNRFSSLINLNIDNKFICSGKGSNVLGDPLNSICWLANKLISRGKFIKAGEIITTGNTLDKPIFASPETYISVEFEGLGEVIMRYS